MLGLKYEIVCHNALQGLQNEWPTDIEIVLTLLQQLQSIAMWINDNWL